MIEKISALLKGKSSVHLQYNKFDAYAPEYDTHIEIDGPMHFHPVFGYSELAKKEKTDKRKRSIVNRCLVIQVSENKKLDDLAARAARSIQDKTWGADVDGYPIKTLA